MNNTWLLVYPPGFPDDSYDIQAFSSEEKLLAYLCTIYPNKKRLRLVPRYGRYVIYNHNSLAGTGYFATKLTLDDESEICLF